MGALLEVFVLLAIVVGIVLAADYVADMPSAKAPGQMAPDLDPRG